MTRVEAREIAMHLVFSLSFGNAEAGEVLDRDLTEERFQQLKEESPLYAQFPSRRQEAYIRRVVNGVFLHGPELDGYISKYARGWAFSRIPRMAAAILRTSMYEILYMDEIPNAAAINSAVEIAKKYEDPKVVSFINGILGSFSRAEFPNTPARPEKQEPDRKKGPRGKAEKSGQARVGQVSAEQAPVPPAGEASPGCAVQSEKGMQTASRPEGEDVSPVPEGLTVPSGAEQRAATPEGESDFSAGEGEIPVPPEKDPGLAVPAGGPQGSEGGPAAVGEEDGSPLPAQEVPASQAGEGPAPEAAADVSPGEEGEFVSSGAEGPVSAPAAGEMEERPE